jgi:acetyl-CoA carboxylase biotin carboxyl carrier protein
MGLSHDDVLQILALLDASDFDELRLETSDYKLHVRRSAPLPPGEAAAFAPSTGSAAASVAPAAAQPPVVPAPVTAAPVAAPPPIAAAAPAPAASAPAAGYVGALADVTTPLLGTFYRSPQPGAPPFVDVGSTVDVDTVIGIVEVMKLMSSVAAGVRGVVVEIAAKDGQLVEYGEVLMRIAPQGA